MASFADIIELVSKGVIEDIAHTPTEVVIIESLQVLLESRGADGELKISIRRLDVAGYIEERLIFAVVVHDTPDIFFRCTTCYNVIDAVGVHKSEAQLLESSEAIETGRGVNVEEEDDNSYYSDSR